MRWFGIKFVIECLDSSLSLIYNIWIDFGIVLTCPKFVGFGEIKYY